VCAQATALQGGETLYLTAPTISLTTPHPFSIADVVPHASAPVPNSMGGMRCYGAATSASVPKGGLRHFDAATSASVPSSEGELHHFGAAAGCQVATIHVKVAGSWTSALQAHAQLTPNKPLPLKVRPSAL